MKVNKMGPVVINSHSLGSQSIVVTCLEHAVISIYPRSLDFYIVSKECMTAFIFKMAC